MRDFQCSYFGVCLIEIQSRKYLKQNTFKRWCLNPKWFSDSLVTPRNGPSILGTFWRVQVDNMYIPSVYIYILCFFMFFSANFIGSSRFFGVPLRFMTFWCSCWFWNHSIFMRFEGDFDTPPRPSPPPIGTAGLPRPPFQHPSIWQL